MPSTVTTGPRPISFPSVLDPAGTGLTRTNFTQVDNQAGTKPFLDGLHDGGSTRFGPPRQLLIIPTASLRPFFDNRFVFKPPLSSTPEGDRVPGLRLYPTRWWDTGEARATDRVPGLPPGTGEDRVPGLPRGTGKDRVPGLPPGTGEDRVPGLPPGSGEDRVPCLRPYPTRSPRRATGSDRHAPACSSPLHLASLLGLGSRLG